MSAAGSFRCDRPCFWRAFKKRCSTAQRSTGVALNFRPRDAGVLHPREASSKSVRPVPGVCVAQLPWKLTVATSDADFPVESVTVN
jgi:hypothetical protein